MVPKVHGGGQPVGGRVSAPHPAGEPGRTLAGPGADIVAGTAGTVVAVGRGLAGAPTSIVVGTGADCWVKVAGGARAVTSVVSGTALAPEVVDERGRLGIRDRGDRCAVRWQVRSRGCTTCRCGEPKNEDRRVADVR